jgi:hypothetical protein
MCLGVLSFACEVETMQLACVTVRVCNVRGVQTTGGQGVGVWAATHQMSMYDGWLGWEARGLVCMRRRGPHPSLSRYPQNGSSSPRE